MKIRSVIVSFIRAWRDERGTATAEATIVLPVMGIVWAGMLLQFTWLDSKFVAAEKARRDAWQFSASACEGAPPQYENGLPSNGSANNPEWLNMLCEIPVIKTAVGSMMGYSTVARGWGQAFEGPRWLGAKAYRAHYDYYVMCNEKRKTMGQVIEESMCENFKKLGLDLDFALDCPPHDHVATICED